MPPVPEHVLYVWFDHVSSECWNSTSVHAVLRRPRGLGERREEGGRESVRGPVNPSLAHAHGEPERAQHPGMQV